MSFIWSAQSAEKFFHLRLQHEWLFKKKKQAWRDFYNILLDNGFPKALTMDQMRKKWQYTFDAYKEAKAKNNKTWLYFKIFEKYLGKNTSLDKYESWNDEWRLKLIQACQKYYEKNKSKQVDYKQWRAVEIELRSDDLPAECCIQDIQGLFHHLKQTFHRKYRITLRKGDESVDWPLYDAMLEFHQTCEPNSLEILQLQDTMSVRIRAGKATSEPQYKSAGFKWTKDMTESFIQIRLQHEWLFRERKRPWKEFSKVLVENGYPRLTNREIQKKWLSIYREYQKSIASNNTNWIYYTLFQVYLGESSLNLDPLQNWQEKWVISLIEARGKHDQLFEEFESSFLAWREVEKELRVSGLPLDHSLLDLEVIWEHLKKTFRWKQKFAEQGILTEVWPYFNAMAEYCENEAKVTPTEVNLACDIDADDGFSDEDIKPLCEMSKVEAKMEVELVEEHTCRACGASGECGSLLEGDADKLRAVGGVKVEKSDGLPDRICSECSEELERAYQFRMKCQATDKQFRLNSHRVKQETPESTVPEDRFEDFDTDFDFPKKESETDTPKITIRKIKLDRLKPRKVRPKNKHKISKVLKKKPERPKNVIPIGPKMRKNYVYRRICEVCGKNVTNMKEHMNGHTNIRFDCEVCRKSFKYKSGLILHKLTHSDQFVKVCQICGKKFKILAQYKRHFVYHADERKFTCETCGKSFNTRDILTVHCRSHTDERPFACPECAKTFRTTGCVARHRRIVHKIMSQAMKERSFKIDPKMVHDTEQIHHVQSNVIHM